MAEPGVGWDPGCILYVRLHPLLSSREECCIVQPMEHAFSCPYCGEEISMVLDFSVGRQTYIEDCEVCCKPIEITFTVEDDELGSFQAKTLG